MCSVLPRTLMLSLCFFPILFAVITVLAVCIGIPSSAGRLEILSVYLSKMPTSLTTQDVAEIANRTHGMSRDEQ